MKDIDFDELDRAVSMLMGGVKETPSRSSAKTLSINSTLKEGEEPEYGKIQRAAEKIGSEALTVPPAEVTEIITDTQSIGDMAAVLPMDNVEQAAVTPISPTMPRPAGGRFMDVMHPSSDMKTTSTIAPSSTEEAVRPPVAEPLSSQNELRSDANSPAAEQEESAFEISLDTDVMADMSTDEDSDSISVSSQRDSTFESSAEVLQGTQPVADSEPEKDSPVEPLTSPFIPDAKVEKRPLGGTNIPVAVAGDDTDFSSIDNPYANDKISDTQLSPAAASSSIEIPAELSADLMGIETGFNDNIAMESSDSGKSTMGPQGVDTSEKNTEQGSSSGTIYDMAEYHKPIEQTTQRSYAWLWVTIIGIIVLIAGGAVFYLLVLNK